MSRLVGFDVGRTHCRAYLIDDGRLLQTTRTPAVPTPVDARSPGRGGVVAVAGQLRITVQSLCPHGVDSVVAGFPGLLAAPNTATALAEELARQLPGTAAFVTSDLILAHAALLGGSAGAIVVSGTGSAALAVSDDGQVAQRGGLGPALVDPGSGHSIGRLGLLAAMEAEHDQEHIQEHTSALATAATTRFGPLDQIAQVVAHAPSPVAEVASFAADVLRCADEGDARARTICAEAGHALGDLVHSAAGAAGLETTARVGLSGGVLGRGSLVRKALTERLELRGEAALADQPDWTTAFTLLANGHCGYAQMVAHAGDPGGHPTPDTEAPLDGLDDLDLWETRAIVEEMIGQDSTVAAAVAACAGDITEVADLVVDRWRLGGRLVYVGAGTSGRLAALDAAEIPPTYGTDPARVVAVLAGGDDAAAAASEGSEDDGAAGVRELAALQVGACDVVVGVTASGSTPFVLSSLQAARAAGATTVALTNNTGAAVAEYADHLITPTTGPEVVAGSTRMKAGTAAKMVLNTLTTTVMIRLGKTFGNEMVDVRAANAKLAARCRRMVARIAAVTPETAGQTLTDCDGEVPTALVMLLADVDPQHARRALEDADGSVRRALALVRTPQEQKGDRT